MLTVRHVEHVDDKEIEVWSVMVPRSIEADGAAAIDTYVANELLSREEEAAKASALIAESPVELTEESTHG